AGGDIGEIELQGHGELINGDAATALCTIRDPAKAAPGYCSRSATINQCFISGVCRNAIAARCSPIADAPPCTTTTNTSQRWWSAIPIATWRGPSDMWRS